MMQKESIEKNISQEEINKMGQLWSLYYDTEKHHCIGLVELSDSILNHEELIDFDKKMPLAYKNLEKIPFDNNEAYQNILIDLLVISACPNIYLFLEALYEGKPQHILDFHLNAYDNIQKSIGEYKTDPEAKIYPSLDRINKKFSWSYNSKGYIINQYGQKVVRFIDPKLAQWVSLVGSQFSTIFQLFFVKSLNKSEFAESMISIDMDNHSLYSDGEKESTYQSYLKMKELLPQLKWDINKNLKNMRIFLE